MTRQINIRTARRRARFLAALERCAIVSRAAEAAGASRTAFYSWRAEDPDFARDWDAAVELGIGALEDAALQLAMEGVEVPVFHQGERVGTQRRYFERLLMFMLRKRRPAIYGEQRDAGAPEGVAYGGRSPFAAPAAAPQEMPADRAALRDFFNERGLELVPVDGRLSSVDLAWVPLIDDDWIARTETLDGRGTPFKDALNGGAALPLQRSGAGCQRPEGAGAASDP